jgi:uncharacterized protein DUF2865
MRCVKYRVTARPARPLGPIAAIMVVAATASSPASAQNLFDLFFGGGWRSNSSPGDSSADPNGQSPKADTGQAGQRESGSSLGFCVRLCDGRYFPIQRSSGANVTQACSSACPAARTKIFWGGEVGYSTANDGSRYRDLPSAFAYRDRQVAGCTCTGKSPYGLATGNVTEDPTLRPGDIVATNRGFVAYTGGRGGSDFTPIEAYGGLAAELRNRLTGTQTAPREPDSSFETTGAVAADGRRVQLDR